MKGLLVAVVLVMLASDCWPAEPLSKADRQALASARSAAIRQRGSQRRAAARNNFLGALSGSNRVATSSKKEGSAMVIGGGANGRGEDQNLYNVLRRADFANRTSGGK